ncbi:hypothetical protein AYJ54_00460 [Bradyrhizobium centrolobii]|uniref:Transposase n=1 Tax=Bradyrhizobium centrolobii TaxID=1505087 RepID=A0A176YFK1_9BRAD|nr:hypothetical protein [Bradyrhizobium centrolobii]OAF05413.1 hypothetical protein AYJ54_00460 [Bradyrhizobium centrolobii]
MSYRCEETPRDHHHRDRVAGRLSQSQRRRLAESLTDAVPVPEVGQQRRPRGVFSILQLLESGVSAPAQVAAIQPPV